MLTAVTRVISRLPPPTNPAFPGSLVRRGNPPQVPSRSRYFQLAPSPVPVLQAGISLTPRPENRHHIRVIVEKDRITRS